MLWQAQTVINGFTAYPIINNPFVAFLVADKDTESIYVAGQPNIGSQFYGAAPVGNADVFVMKMWTNGTIIWANVYGGAQAESVTFNSGGLVQDSATGDLFLSGSTRSSQFTSGSTQLSASVPFVVRINSATSAVIWTSIGTPVAGEFLLVLSKPLITSDYVILFTDIYSSGPNVGPYMNKYYLANGTRDDSGSKYVSFAQNGISMVAADYDSVTGNAYLVGATTTAILDQASPSVQQVYWAAVATNGTGLMARILSATPGDIFVNNVVIDSVNQFVYLGGSTKNSIGSVNTEGPSSSFDAYLAQYSFSGVLNWARIFGGASNDELDILRVQPVSGIIYGGGKLLNADYGGFTKAGSNDLFLISYFPNGTRASFVLVGASGSDQAYGIGFTVNSKVVAGGYFNGTGGVYVNEVFPVATTTTTDVVTTSAGVATTSTSNVPVVSTVSTSAGGAVVVTVYQAVTATPPAVTAVATHTAVVTSAANGTTTQNAESAATGEKIGLSFAFLFVGLALGGLGMFFLSRSKRFKKMFESSEDAAKTGSTQFQNQTQATPYSIYNAGHDLESNAN